MVEKYKKNYSVLILEGTNIDIRKTSDFYYRKNTFIYKSSVGILKIEANDRAVTSITRIDDTFDLLDKQSNNLYNNATINLYSNSSVLIHAISELDEYFNKKRKHFSFPMELYGTEFQVKVWKSLYDIPYGVVKSYKDIAISIGNPKACRAIGNANNKNPISIAVPWHRVIGSDGALTGYGGGLDMKAKLLKLENIKWIIMIFILPIPFNMRVYYFLYLIYKLNDKQRHYQI